MVTVPRYERNVESRPVARQNVTTQASPEDFGAAVGRGLQSVASGLDRASQAMQAVRDLEDMTAAKEADNALAAWTRNRLYGEGGYLTLEGKAAVEGRAGFEQEWEKQRRSLGEKLRGGAMARYVEASNARKDSVFQTAAVHSANGRKTWFREASAARIEMFGDEALAAFADADKVQRNIALGQAELRQQAQLEGWDADTLAQKEAAFISGIHRNIAMRIAQDDAIAAMDYVHGHTAQITGGDQLALETALHEEVKGETAKREAARIVDLVNSGEPVDVEAELAAIEDDDIRILTDHRIGALIAAQTAGSEAQAKAAKAELWRVIDQGGTPDDVPLEVRQSAGMEAISAGWSFVERRSLRTVPKSDETLLYDLRRDAAADPEAFADVDLNQFRDRIAPDDITSLTKLQTDTISDARKAREKGATYSGAFSLAEDSLAAVGLSVAGKTGADRDTAAQRIGQFQNALAGMLDEFVAANERAPNDSEVREMVNKLLLPIVIKTPKNRFDLFDMTAIFGGSNERPGFVFEAGTRGDNSEVEVRADYLSIPIDLRRAIASDLESELGRKPSEEEVADRYEAWVLGG